MLNYGCEHRTGKKESYTYNVTVIMKATKGILFLFFPF